MSGVIALGAGGCCCLCVVVFLIVFFATSIAKVETTQWALKYSWWSQSVDTDVITTPGMKWVGMGNYLIPFPNYNMYVYFRNFENAEYMEDNNMDIFQPPLSVRTKDGLTIQLEMEFVYQLQRDNIRSLYMLVGEAGYNELLTSVAEGVLDNLATTFTAKQFYNDRSEMSAIFLANLNGTMASSGLAINVQSLQLQPAIFPAKYSQAIVDTLDAKQDILVAEEELATATVTKETDLLKATMNAQTLAIDSYRDANITVINNNISVETFVYAQQQTANGYAKAMEFFAENGVAVPSFMSYLNVRAMADHTQDTKTVQVSPL